MVQFVNWVSYAFSVLLNLLSSIEFAIGGTVISYLDLIFGFFLIFFAVSVFWKGARA